MKCIIAMTENPEQDDFAFNGNPKKMIWPLFAYVLAKYVYIHDFIGHFVKI